MLVVYTSGKKYGELVINCESHPLARASIGRADERLDCQAGDRGDPALCACDFACDVVQGSNMNKCAALKAWIVHTDLYVSRLIIS